MIRLYWAVNTIEEKIYQLAVDATNVAEAEPTVFLRRLFGSTDKRIGVATAQIKGNDDSSNFL